MKRLLVLGALLLAAGSARAHFIYLLPDAKNEGLQMVFTDDLGPDKNVPITKIAQTKLFARDQAGQEVPVKVVEDKHHYQVTPAGKGTIDIAGTCTYGVIAKGKNDPFLLVYHPRAILFRGGFDKNFQVQAWDRLPLQIVSVKDQPGIVQVLRQGKPAGACKVHFMYEGSNETVDGMTDAEGRFPIEKEMKKVGWMPQPGKLVSGMARFIDNKSGTLDGKEYKEVRHYATLAFRIPGGEATGRKPAGASSVAFVDSKDDVPADPAATKLLADARAARYVWKDFPGFRADLVVNDDGRVHKGTVEVSAKGKVDLTLEDKDLKTEVRRSIASLVGHRLPGGSYDTPCAFADKVVHHPQGRLLKVLNDEMHSSYRIRDRQILEVNRRMQDFRFTITVLENAWTKDKQCLPTFYVVNSWDLKTGTLKNAISHHHSWTTVGGLQLPETLATVTATPVGLRSQAIRFTGHKLNR